MKKLFGGLALTLLVPMVFVILLTSTQPYREGCAPGGATLAAGSLPGLPATNVSLPGATIAGLDAEQTRNAATIVQVGRDLEIAPQGILIALAVAKQESTFHNLADGDRDSLGLFQQRPSQGWGTPSQIQNPVLATQAFFGLAEHTHNTGLLDIEGWETMPLTVAAQAVQRSGFPDAYAAHEDLARSLLAQLDPDSAALLASSTQPAFCAALVSAVECPPTDSPAENGLTPDALLVLRCVDQVFGSHTYGGVGSRTSNPGSDHPSGRAVDVMVDQYTSRTGIAHGDAVAAWLQQHHRELGITYLIWRGRIWRAGDTNWDPYSHPSGATDPTSRHMDHVHVSVHGTRATGFVLASAGTVQYPLPAGTYTDQRNFGEHGGGWTRLHTGTDFSAAAGTPVLAAHGGTIQIDTSAAWAGRWLVKVTLGPKQLTTWYAHMRAVSVRQGQTVAAGQLLGEVGSEGNSTGPHLHFEVHPTGGSIYQDPVDPTLWLEANVGKAGETVRLAHANIFAGETPAQFRRDLAEVLATRPDFVTLNEAYRRTDAQLRTAGYASWRAAGPFDARETPVLWRTDRWRLVDRGSQLMHSRDVKWGERWTNWVTLRDNRGRTVTIVSGHASPGGAGRAGLLEEYVTALNGLIGRLDDRGPVLVGADLNVHYRATNYPRPLLARSGTVSTFDVLGEPSGGWATGIHGGIIDYLLARSATPLAHTTRDLPHSDHRLLYGDFTLGGAR